MRFFFFAFALLSASLPVMGASERPNILWITCEDISPNLGCYGDKYAVTPTLDRFASQGVRYTNAFAVTGVCAPNRSCLITGVYPSTLGSHNMRCRTRLPDFIKCFPEYLRHAGYWTSNNVKTDYNFPVPKGAWDECSRRAHWRNRRPGQPFFSVFNFTVTHESQIRLPKAAFRKRTARLKSSDKHDPARAPVPPFHPDTPEVRRDWAHYYDLITALDYQVKDLLAQLEADGLVDSTIVFFFSDHGAGMPGCKKWIWESGIHVPLIVRFPEKFRKYAPAPPGGVSDRLVSFVDFAPTVLSLAGVPIPAHMQGRAFLGRAEAPERDAVFLIRDRMAERYDIVRGLRTKNFQYLRNFMPHLSWSQYVSYTEKMPTMQVWRRLAEEGRLSGPAARYFRPCKPVEELYDVKRDPFQIRNLAGRPEAAGVLEKLRSELRKFQIESRDLGLLPEYEIERRSVGTTPYEMGRDPLLNPVKRLLEAADKANACDPARVPELKKLLRDPDAAVRFWGAVGFVALGTKARRAEKELSSALGDSSPVVRVCAAEALCACGRKDIGLPALLDALGHRSPFVRLRAMNALDRLGKWTAEIRSAVAKAAMKSRKNPQVASYLSRMIEYTPKRHE